MGENLGPGQPDAVLPFRDRKTVGAEQRPRAGGFQCRRTGHRFLIADMNDGGDGRRLRRDVHETPGREVHRVIGSPIALHRPGICPRVAGGDVARFPFVAIELTGLKLEITFAWRAADGKLRHRAFVTALQNDVHHAGGGVGAIYR